MSSNNNNNANVSIESTMSNVDYTRYLQQQVMSQQLLSGTAIPTVLAGATNFGPWLKRIQNFISTTNMEWGEYLLTGDFAESRIGRNLSDTEISYINRILDSGMYRLIVNSVSTDIQKSVQNFYDKSDVATARDVLVYLKQKYADMKVRGVADFVGQYKTVSGKTIKDQVEWAEKCAAYMLKYVEPKEGDDGTISNEEKLAALLMFTFHPEKLKNLMSFIGKKEVVGVREVSELLKDTAPVSNEIVLAAHKRGKPSGKKQHGCYFCGGDHSLHHCKKMKQLHPDASIYKGATAKSSDTKSNDPLYGLCATDGSIAPHAWIFDSGSSIHVCNDRSKFVDFFATREGEISGLSGKVQIEGCGTVVIGKLHLHNVAYVASAPFNLISISAATLFSGASFTMGQDYLTISTNGIDSAVLANRENGLYIYNHNTSNDMVDQHVAMLADTSSNDPMLPHPKSHGEETSLFHARLGHPGSKIFNQLATTLGVPKITSTNFTICPTCSLSKATVKKGKVSETVYTVPLQLIQVDLVGPFRYESYSSDKYFMTIRDAFSRYYEVIHLKSKSEAADKLINWIKRVENFFSNRGGFRVTAVRTDNGGEFNSVVLHTFFNSNGIQHQLTVPHNSFQNGSVERANRTIEDRARALLIGGRIPFALWPEAVSTAAYLINRTPTARGFIPACLWFDIKAKDLKYDHLKVFGCAAYATLPQSLRNGKLAATSVKGVFVGYDINRKAYRIFHPESHKIFCSNQVIFEENEFPLEKINTVDDPHYYATSTIGGVPSYTNTSVSTTLPIIPAPAATASTAHDFPAYTESSDDHDTTDPPSIEISHSSPVVSAVEPESPVAEPSVDNSVHQSDHCASPDSLSVNNEVPSSAATADALIHPAAAPMSPLMLSNADAMECIPDPNSDSEEELSSDPSSHSDLPPADSIDILRGIVTPDLLASNSSPVVTKLIEELHGKDQTIKWLQNAEPRTKKGAHSLYEDVTGKPIEDVGAMKILKKRSTNIAGIANSLSLPTQVSTSSDQVITNVRNTTTDATVPIDSFQVDNIKSALRNPEWDPLGTPVGQQSLPEPTLAIPDSTAVGFQSPAPADSNSICVRSTSSPSTTLPPSLTAPGQHVVMTAVLSGFAMAAKVSTLPRSINQALGGSNGDLWRAACLKELNAFKSHATYSLVQLPTGRKALGSRWVFTEKSGGVLKARLVAMGNTQKEGIDYTETFAPVIRYESVRVFLALAASMNLRIHQMDVDTAFLNSKLDEPVYVRQPPGFQSTTHPDYVWKLSGGMYGLKQSPLLWNKHIHGTLINAGFTRNEGDFGLYFRHTSVGMALIALYVDDLLIAAPSLTVMEAIKKFLTAAYSMKDLGRVTKFLGMTICQDDKYISLDMNDYITTSIQSLNIAVHKKVHTPIASIKPLFDLDSPKMDNITTYQSIIGQLLFAANAGRPDISYVVSVLSRFLKDPRKIHYAAAVRVFQYLYTTRHFGLQYTMGSPLSLVVYSDAASAPFEDLPYSTGGYVTQLAGGTVTWSSKKIKSTVCLSSTESEYITASNAVREIEWLTNMFQFMSLRTVNVKLLVDNQPALQLAKHPVFHPRTKHIALHYHKIRESVDKGLVNIEYVPTDRQVADIMTKALARDKFTTFMNDMLVSKNSH